MFFTLNQMLRILFVAEDRSFGLREGLFGHSIPLLAKGDKYAITETSILGCVKASLGHIILLLTKGATKYGITCTRCMCCMCRM